MNIEEVLRLYNLFLANTIQIWIDGGWGIDALLGEQTREHEDLDIAVDRKDAKKLREILLAEVYTKEIPRSDASEYQYVLGDKKGNKIDVHVFEFDEKGNQIYGVAYAKGSLTGVGFLNGQKVNCIPLEYVMKWHELYEPEKEDYQDVKNLMKKFGVKPPSNYKI